MFRVLLKDTSTCSVQDSGFKSLGYVGFLVDTEHFNLLSKKTTKNMKVTWPAFASHNVFLLAFKLTSGSLVLVNRLAV